MYRPQEVSQDRMNIRRINALVHVHTWCVEERNFSFVVSSKLPL